MNLDHPPADQSRWRIVFLLIGFSFMTWFNRVSMAVAYDASIQKQYDISEEAIGTVYSAFFLSYMLFMTPGGWFIDRFGPKLALTIMGLGSGVFGAMTGMAGLPVVASAGLLVVALLIIRFGMGFLSAPFYPAASRMVANEVRVEKQAFSNGLIQGAAALGMAAAFPLFGAFIDAFDWPMAFLVSGSVTMVLALAWIVFAAEHVSPPVAPRTKPFLAPPDIQIKNLWFMLFTNRNIWLLTLSYAAVGYLEYLFFFWMNHYFDKVMHIPKDASRIYTAALLLSMGVGMVAGGGFADFLRVTHGAWVGRALVPMLGMALSAVFLFLGLLGESVEAIVICLALAMFWIGATEAPVWTAAVELGGRQGGTAAAIVNTGGNLGGFIAPFFTPLVSHAIRDTWGLSDQAGWQWGISLAGALCLSGAMLWWWIEPQRTGQEG